MTPSDSQILEVFYLDNGHIAVHKQHPPVYVHCILHKPQAKIKMRPTLGEIAYNAYCQTRDWKSFRGEDLPKFIDSPEDIRAGWEIAAQAVKDALPLFQERP